MPYIGKGGNNGFGIRERYRYSASGSQTAFTGSDLNSKTLQFDSGSLLDVYLNGVLLDTADYNTSTANTVTLTSGATASDEVMIVVYDVFSLSDAMPKTGGTFTGAVTHTGATALTNKLTVLASDGTVDNDWVMDVRNNEATDDRSYGLRVSAGSTSTDRALDILDHAQANTLLRVNGAGTVTMPKQPCFRASVRNQTGSTVGVTGNLTFDREVIDLGGNYDTSNGRFTAPVDGTYYFSHAGLGASGGSGTTHTSGASWHLEFLLNGSRTFFQFYWYAAHPSSGGTQSQYINAYIDMVITLSAGDYITVQLPDGTDSYYINPNSNATYEPYFQGFLIG